MDLSSLTLIRIKELLGSTHEPSGELLQGMALDQRVGVQRLHKRYQRAAQKKAANVERLLKMKKFEDSLIGAKGQLAAGVDESGRGPLAGPVVAAAVIFPNQFEPEKFGLAELDDSKKITPAKRSVLAVSIKNAALAWGVGLAKVSEIERLNIHRASLLAMSRAVSKLALWPELLLVDGLFSVPELKIPQRAVTGGDALCPSIAAASIIAKVTRDRLMNLYHLQYPEYGFNAHKGYGTAAHIRALAQVGICPLHRRDFAPVKYHKHTMGKYNTVPGGVQAPD